MEKQYLDSLFKKPVRNPTYAEFNRFYNSTVENYNVLKVVNNSTETSDPILVYHIEDKLDSESIIFWRRERKGGETPTFSKLVKFIHEETSA